MEVRLFGQLEVVQEGVAVPVYRIRDRLVSELGIEPGPALRELQARILAQDPSLRRCGWRPEIARARKLPRPSPGIDREGRP